MMRILLFCFPYKFYSFMSYLLCPLEKYCSVVIMNILSSWVSLKDDLCYSFLVDIYINLRKFSSSKSLLCF